MDQPDPLLALHRDGTLAARYPEVRALLADRTGPDLLRAGQLLARLDADAVLREHPDTPTVTVAVTGHGTLAPLIPPLTAELARHGMLLRAVESTFDSYVFALSDPDSALYADDTDLVLCVLDPSVVFDEVPVPWQPADVERVLAEKLRLVEGLAIRFADNGGSALVLNTLPLPRRYTAQLVDQRSRARLGTVWREANAKLLALTDEHPAVTVVDLDPLIAEGVPAVDPRLDTYAKVHLSPPLLASYAREVGHLARYKAGRTSKCLAVDLDNTVWGGILGDDGIDGIEVADSFRGEAFRAFQRVVKQLGAQGVLVAAVSKNDSELVREALRDHPGMTLRENDFVRVVANWQPKHDNLRGLAKTLNVNVDSFVFVDDSPYERGLVRRELPGVAVVAVDDEPALHVAALLRDGWFDVRELTAEDRTRTDKYRAEAARQDFLETFSSIEDYLRELDIRVRLAPPRPAEMPRVSQLTLRTNQFNLTTERLAPPEVERQAAGPGTRVLAIHAHDRFGDNGLVGAIFLRREGTLVRVDNFLLSCRVFSRGIERACLSAVLAHARDSGADGVVGTYRPTAKNRLVRDFYPKHGFGTIAGDGSSTTYRHDLVDIPPVPEHVHFTAALGDTW
jgi:FkbH-like protein